LLAAEITRRYPREQILEWYLNSADFGQRSYGIDAAALTYFGKHASDLSLAESALLASIPLNPADNPVAEPQAATQQQVVVLRAMLQAGLISETEAAKAGAAQLALASQPELRGNLAAFETYLTQRIEGNFGRPLLGRSGLRVRTSLNWDLHQQAACTLESQISRLNGGEPGAVLPAPDGSNCLAAGLLTPVRPRDAGVDHAIEAGAVVMTNPETGELLSLLGQVSSPASAAGLTSPFTALTAFAQGYSPASMLLDVSPTEDRPGSPAPAYPDHGPVRLRIALANQYQAALDRLIDQVGSESVQRTLASFGLKDQPIELPVDDVQQLDTNLLEFVNAYGVFANEGTLIGTRVLDASSGEHLEPVVILMIEDGTRRLLYQADPAAQALVSAQLAYLMVDILSDESARWPSVGKGSPLEVGRTAGVVASSTPGASQAWTLGFTPEVVVGVMLEAMHNAEAEALTALNGPAPVWHALIQYATRDLPPSAWNSPPGVSTLEVCDPSGLLPTPYCPAIVREVFLNGTEPTTADNLFQPFLVNRETEKLATLNTPPDLVEEQVFMVVPPGAEAWAEKSGIARPPEEYDTLRAGEIDPLINIRASRALQRPSRWNDSGSSMAAV
jgi:membrane peptidoglycan carboxypeptidase